MNMVELEKYIWDEEKISPTQNKYLTVVIYDISDNKVRYKMAKVLEKYGYRIQKSAFEGMLKKTQFEKMKTDILRVIGPEDNVKIYRLKGVSEVYGFGKAFDIKNEDVIII